MITDAILYLMSSIGLGILYLFPDWDLPIMASIITAINWAFDMMRTMNWLLPVNEMIRILQVVLYFEVILIGIKVGLFVFNLLPFVHTHELRDGK